MAKNQRNAPRKQKKTAKRSRSQKNSNNRTSFGPVSTIDTAPVAIGNSIRGSEPHVLQIEDGVRVIGRDYAFTPQNVGSVTNWMLSGGFPLTPACFPTTSLKAFCQLYNKFKINGIVAHYITSSATSSAGDILFQYNKNTVSSIPNWTSQSFLPYVLSDPMTVLGPQWTNHSAYLKPTSRYLSTDYGVSTDQSEYSAGDLFIYTKTSTAGSPGYVLFDYDISFKELSINPRAGYLPTSKAMWRPCVLQQTSLSTTAYTTAVAASTNTVTWSGAVAITAPTMAPGEVYKCVLDITNATITNATVNNLFAFQSINGAAASTLLSLVDGYTFYIAIDQNSNQAYIYSDEAQAFVQEGTSTTLLYGVTNAATAFTIPCWIKLIGSANPSYQQVQY